MPPQVETKKETSLLLQVQEETSNGTWLTVARIADQCPAGKSPCLAYRVRSKTIAGKKFASLFATKVDHIWKLGINSAELAALPNYAPPPVYLDWGVLAPLDSLRTSSARFKTLDPSGSEYFSVLNSFLSCASGLCSMSCHAIALLAHSVSFMSITPNSKGFPGYNAKFGKHPSLVVFGRHHNIDSFRIINIVITSCCVFVMHFWRQEKKIRHDLSLLLLCQWVSS